jgi:hypothetical protein
MGVHEGRGQLSKIMRELSLHWQEAKMSWQDSRSREFEKNCLEPLEADLKQAVSAMDQMSNLLNRIYTECE